MLDQLIEKNIQLNNEVRQLENKNKELFDTLILFVVPVEVLNLNHYFSEEDQIFTHELKTLFKNALNASDALLEKYTDEIKNNLT